MDWNKGIQYAQLVNAAYSKFGGKAYTTPGFNEVATIYANDLATDLNPARGTQRVIIGLILQAASGDAVVAFRGTEGIKEWVQDAEFRDCSFEDVVSASGRTEDGFTAMYKSMTIGNGTNVPVASGLSAALKQPVASLTICGHSLGGALASLFALDVAAHAAAAPFNDPVVYTYASPRTGNTDFATKYSQSISTTYRYVDNVDLVPKLPAPVPTLPYKHVCAQIEMDSLTLIPPRVRLQPNPVCWHILTSYIYLMSLSSGATPPTPPEAECVPKDPIEAILAKAKVDLNDQKSIADQFTASARNNMGGN
jgi:hypothetical protein